jgi:circadian clock protein KaiC
MNSFQAVPRSDVANTGIEGLDDILAGGFSRDRLYLVEGNPGAGKTTLALQFLIAGVRRGEPGVYATLSETEEELRDVAASHGWSLDGISICDLQTAEESLHADSQYTLFHPSEIELTETTRAVLELVERVQPRRVVFDSLSEMRLLARDSLRYRRQILALKHYFTGRKATVLLLDYGVSKADFQLQSLTHGVLSLEHAAPAYGRERRRILVEKMRGVAFRGGYHDFLIRTGGLEVFPRLVAAEHRADVEREEVGTGLAELDALLGGGLQRGTSTMVLGPAGVGKSTVAAQIVAEAARRGEQAIIYAFDESPASWRSRADALGMEMSRHLEQGLVTVRQVDPAELTPGEMAHQIRAEVDRGARLVVLDSINGYQHAMPEQNALTLHLHELLAYLNQRGVLSIMVTSQHGILGELSGTPIDLTYLADNVVLMRFFEVGGRVRQAISVVKKRSGNHERTIREIRLSASGLELGDTLSEFSRVLTGHPEYTGDQSPLLAFEKERVGADVRT